MNRNEFLKKLGFKGAALMALYCSGGCEHHLPPVYDIDFTIDLTNSEYASLKIKGGFVVVNYVVIVYTTDGKFAAATVYCSHQYLPGIEYDYSRNIYSCSEHGAEFDLSGKGLNDRGKNGLKIYQTSLKGNTLRVYG